MRAPLPAALSAVCSGVWSVSEAVACCAQCLEWFVQLNWTGPPDQKVKESLEQLLGQERLEELNQQALTGLSSDGEVRSINSFSTGM